MRDTLEPEKLKPCPRCGNPNVNHGPQPKNEACVCCGAPAAADWRSHHHPYKATNE